jgi:hypothetical protein
MKKTIIFSMRWSAANAKRNQSKISCTDALDAKILIFVSFASKRPLTKSFILSSKLETPAQHRLRSELSFNSLSLKRRSSKNQRNFPKSRRKSS